MSSTAHAALSQALGRQGRSSPRPVAPDVGAPEDYGVLIDSFQLSCSRSHPWLCEVVADSPLAGVPFAF